MGCSRLSQAKKPARVQTLDELDSIVRRLSNIEAEIEGMRRRVKQFDYDLQDAIDGFYRRRQSDRMREVRDEESAKPQKPRTWKDLLAKALENDRQSPRGSAEQPSGE